MSSVVNSHLPNGQDHFYHKASALAVTSYSHCKVIQYVGVIDLCIDLKTVIW